MLIDQIDISIKEIVKSKIGELLTKVKVGRAKNADDKANSISNNEVAAGRGLERKVDIKMSNF